MFNALVYRQQAKIAGARQAAMIKERLHVTQHRWAAVTIGHHTIDEIGAREMQVLTTNPLASMVKQAISIAAKQSGYIGHGRLLST